MVDQLQLKLPQLIYRKGGLENQCVIPRLEHLQYFVASVTTRHHLLVIVFYALRSIQDGSRRCLNFIVNVLQFRHSSWQLPLRHLQCTGLLLAFRKRGQWKQGTYPLLLTLQHEAVLADVHFLQVLQNLPLLKHRHPIRFERECPQIQLLAALNEELFQRHLILCLLTNNLCLTLSLLVFVLIYRFLYLYLLVVKRHLPVMNDAFTFEAFDLQQVRESVFALDEVANELGNAPVFLDLEIVLTEQPIQVHGHLFGLCLGPRSAVNHGQIVNVVSGAREELLDLLIPYLALYLPQVTVQFEIIQT